MRSQIKRLLFWFLLVCSLNSILQATNPTRAMLYSALLPGGGQIYNREYVKAGVVIGLQAYLTGLAIYHDNKADDYKKLASNTNDAYLQQLYKSRSNEFSEKRTSDFWWMGVTAVLSVLDAYVDAHLSDFDAERDKLHLRFTEDKIYFELRY